MEFNFLLLQYRLYGEAVVKAAVENGASYVDISGEPAVMFSIFAFYCKYFFILFN